MKNRPTKILVSFAIFFAAILLAAAVAQSAWACPLCKEALAQSTDPAVQRLSQGFSRSIALLMSAPYLLFGGLTFYIARSTRRQTRRSSDSSHATK